MDHVITNAGLRLTYLCDWTSIKALDAQIIADDLAETDAGYSVYGWFSRVALTDFDHIVLATNTETGRCAGILTANDGNAALGPFLELRGALVADPMNASKLMSRMLAYMVLRIDSLGTMPRVIAALTSTPSCYELLARFAQTVPAATIFPIPQASLFQMEDAGLARHIARQTLPRLAYECGTGAIRGAKFAATTCFARPTESDPAIEAMFELHLGSSDQLMVVVNMRRCDEQAIANETRSLVRSRSRLLSSPMERTSLQRHRIRKQKPTLTA